MEPTPAEQHLPPVPLRVGNDAAIALDEMCNLGYADTREEMAVVWIERWSRNPATWPRSEADTVPRMEGVATFHHPQTYERQPVEMTVMLGDATMQALRIWARKSAVGTEHLASAVIDEHGTHVAASIHRRNTGRLVAKLQPCWCGQLNRWHTK